MFLSIVEQDDNEDCNNRVCTPLTLWDKNRIQLHSSSKPLCHHRYDYYRFLNEALISVQGNSVIPGKFFNVYEAMTARNYGYSFIQASSS